MGSDRAGDRRAVNETVFAAALTKIATALEVRSDLLGRTDVGFWHVSDLSRLPNLLLGVKRKLGL
jgi:hypothetical protein